MQTNQKLVDRLYTEIRLKDRVINQLTAQLEDAMEENKAQREPEIDSYHDF